ncbi:hypothetical protein [uncultured Shewanella sp.]|uniref:hypothetical protein n=1 Tax=uncultured Shewanella sp. TaxID=173975 RepID=UPI00263030D5|nr:hypothetical protein [uncultured Shewanella sp.]
MNNLSFMFFLISISSFLSIFVCRYSEQQEKERAEHITFIDGRAKIAHDLAYNLGKDQVTLKGTAKFDATQASIKSCVGYFRNCQTHNVIPKPELAIHRKPRLEVIN